MADADSDIGTLGHSIFMWILTHLIGVSLNITLALAIWSKDNNFKGFYLKEINDLCKNNRTSLGKESSKEF